MIPAFAGTAEGRFDSKSIKDKELLDSSFRWNDEGVVYFWAAWTPEIHEVQQVSAKSTVNASCIVTIYRQSVTNRSAEIQF